MPKTINSTAKTYLQTGEYSHGRLVWVCMGFLLVLGLSGCGSSPKGEGLVDQALSLVGLQKLEAPAPAQAPAPAPIIQLPAMPEASKPVKLPMRVHAGSKLNVGASQQSLALLLKVYHLKGHSAFLRAPYETFTNVQPYTSAEVALTREVVLLPGQHYEVEEVVAPDVTHIAVVGLFQKPEAFRWRFVFDVKDSAKQGVALGAHQCALSVTQGKVVGSPPESQRLAGSVCH
jgi:type VI secretion system protein VasD